MRLIHLADYHGPYAGSFIPMLLATLRAARGRGWDVAAGFTPVARGRPWVEELEADGIGVRVAPSHSPRELRGWISDLLDESEGPTIVHTHFTAFDVPAALAARARPNASVLWHLHSRAAPGWLAAARNMVKYAVFGRMVEQILCVAPDIATVTRRRLAPARKVRFVPNAIDASRFPPVTPERRVAAREQLGLPYDATVLMHLGWDWSRKGGDLFLRAAGRVGGAREDIVPVTVGAEAPARTLAAELGLDHLRVLDPTDDVQSLYAAADVFVSSSRAEGMPFAVAEALCSGIAVVASDIPGQVAIGQDIRACRLTSLDPAAIAAGIEETLDRSPEAVREEANEARSAIVRAMDIGAWAESILDLYETGEHPQRSPRPR